MFRDAYEISIQYTFPVVQFVLTFEGKCDAGIGAFVVVNPEGWIITAAHIVEQMVAVNKAANDIIAWEKNTQAVRDDNSISAKERSRRLSSLGTPNKKAAKRAGTAWLDNVTLRDVSILKDADLAVARLDGFDPTRVKAYPTFKDPTKNFRPGASLCKLGYPFAELKPTYDPAANHFGLPSGTEVTFFPIEGIFTRTLNVPNPSPDPGFPVAFVETSSPGLKGQSGGPTFDVHGNIWAIQSQTRSLPLDFSPEIKDGGQKLKEHQFLNVGMGVHVQTVLGFLNQLGVKHTVSAA